MLLSSLLTAGGDSTRTNDPAASHLFWMSTGDIGPTGRVSLGLHQFVVPSARISLFDRIQLSAINAAFSSNVLLGAKLRLLHLPYLSAAAGYDIPVGEGDLGSTVSYWYGSISFRSGRVGLHATLTRERTPTDEHDERNLHVQVGADMLLRSSRDGGTALMIESLVSRNSDGWTPFPLVLAGVRAFGVSSYGDFGVYLSLQQGVKFIPIPVAGVGILF